MKTFCDRLPWWLQRILHCRRIIVTVEFRQCWRLAHPYPYSEICVMSNQVTLQANSTVAQACVVTATVLPAAEFVTWTSSDPTAATVSSTGGQTANVQSIKDPDGNSQKFVTITGTVTVDGQDFSGTGQVTVITQVDETTVSLDFSDPTPPIA